MNKFNREFRVSMFDGEESVEVQVWRTKDLVESTKVTKNPMEEACNHRKFKCDSVETAKVMMADMADVWNHQFELWK